MHFKYNYGNFVRVKKSNERLDRVNLVLQVSAKTSTPMRECHKSISAASHGVQASHMNLLKYTNSDCLRGKLHHL